MRARKFYEEQILKPLENMPEEELPTVVSMIEKLKQEKKGAYLKTIRESSGKFADSLSSTEEFMRRKQEEKLLDR